MLIQSNNSLQGLTDAINADTGSTGVTASIIDDGSSTDPYHILLTGQDASTTFTVSSSLQDGSGNPISFTTTEIQTPQQANLTIDGVPVVSNSNTVTDAIPGVTLNLNAVSSSSDSSSTSSTSTTPQYTDSQLNITPDTSTLTTNINTFVTAYNAIINWINAGVSAASTANSSSSGSQTDPAYLSSPTDAQLSQILIGDPNITALKNDLQNLVSGSADSSSSADGLNNLNSIGITTNLDGTLTVNSSALQNALTTNFTGVADLLAGNGNVGSEGVMQQFNTYLLDETSPVNGIYAQEQQTNQTNQTNLASQVTAQKQLLNQEETTMNEQFTNMELMISTLNSQSTYMDSLYSLAGISDSSSSSASSTSSSSS